MISSKESVNEVYNNKALPAVVLVTLDFSKMHLDLIFHWNSGIL